MVNGEMITLAVGAAVAVGTALYYLFFSDQNRPHNQNPNNRRGPRPPPSTFSSSPPPVSPTPPRQITGKSRSKRPNKRNPGRDDSDNQSDSPCLVCDSSALIKFLPCGHRVFCKDHVKSYMDASSQFRWPLCPNEKCSKEIEDFTT